MSTTAQTLIKLRRDREYRIASRISYRINELQNIPDTLSPDLKTEALIELRGLRLKDLQNQVSE
jgi:SWI/SNF-related matrix-associated actin-dependent regulator of chromatin subfamily A protein 2/4